MGRAEDICKNYYTNGVAQPTSSLLESMKCLAITTENIELNVSQQKNTEICRSVVKSGVENALTLLASITCQVRETARWKKLLTLFPQSVEI